MQKIINYISTIHNVVMKVIFFSLLMITIVVSSDETNIELYDKKGLITYACKNITSPLTLTTENILSQSLYSLRPKEVTSINLSSADGMNENINAYFLKSPLCNLRVLTLPTTHVSEFIHNIFPRFRSNSSSVNKESQIKYFSLETIIGNINVNEKELNQIFGHFSAYEDFVRDNHQIDTANDCVCVFISVENRNSANFYTPDSALRWNNNMNSCIHCRNEESAKGSLIMITNAND